MEGFRPSAGTSQDRALICKLNVVGNVKVVRLLFAFDILVYSLPV